MAKKNKNANYDFDSQVQPAKRMGEGCFANLPDRPLYGNFGEPSYRDGIINSFTSGISSLSGIDENGCHYGDA